MSLSSPIRLSQYKSPLRSLARSFSLSRDRWRSTARHYRSEVEHLRQQRDAAERKTQQLQLQVDRLRCELKQKEAELASVVPLRRWVKLPGHQYSAELIALSCQLSSLIGFRAVPKVLACMSGFLGLSLPCPTRDAVRNWSCRNGAAIIEEATADDDWIWMIDHSVQLGKMFVLVVLGIRLSEMPVGRALRREDMTPLAVLPSTSRDKAEVEKQLTQLAEACRTPLAVLSDGAAELHHGALALKTQGFSGVHLDDMKHKVANLLKKHLKNDKSFKDFSTQLGRTIASIQQTELDHLLPPSKRCKSRFMDFDRIIDWASMAQHQLVNASSPQSQRITDKLGWLDGFKEQLFAWKECRQLIAKVLTWSNEQGVYPGATKALKTQLDHCGVESELAKELSRQMLDCYRHNESQLSKLASTDVRLPCSTEVLESAFGSFKARQGNHGRGTFTSLLAMFASLFDNCSPHKIRERFTRFKNRELKRWIEDAGLNNSTQARRTKAYAQQKYSETENNT